MENAFNMIYKFKINALKKIKTFFLNLKFALTSVQNMKKKFIRVMFKQKSTTRRKLLLHQLFCPLRAKDKHCHQTLDTMWRSF